MSLILSGTDGLSDVDGSAATPAIRGTDANTGIFFPAADTIAFAEGGAEAMRIDSSGNVGIGTTSPDVNLDVTKTSDGVAARFQRSSGGGIVDIETYNGIGGIGTSDNIPFRLNTNNTERMRIDSSGNLLVGTTSSGGVGFTVAFDGAGRILTSNVSAVPFDVYLFKNSGTTVGKITINTASTAYTTTSDYRLKENITPLAGALSVINQLKPVNFTWKLGGESTQGFIAHELQAVVPEAVVGEKDAVDADGNPKYQGIDTSFLVATLTAAIQEQQALITALTARITALETP